jgi:hypothetical protein
LQQQQQMLSQMMTMSATATAGAGDAHLAEHAMVPTAGPVAANATEDFVEIEPFWQNTLNQSWFNECQQCHMPCYFKKLNQGGWWSHPHPQVRCVNVLCPRNKAYAFVCLFVC